ncbi:4-hydroxythreonine-4-phosphate dehydrogenase PdxA [Candidatus Omnitrophota bacterium]
MKKSKPTIGITMGDPGGIGPEVILKALTASRLKDQANFLIIGNFNVFQQTAQLCRIRPTIKRITRPEDGQYSGTGKIYLLDTGSLKQIEFGRPLRAYGELALDCIDAGLDLIKLKAITALVTAPVNKSTINKTGRSFTGHTEYLARACNTNKFAMMLVGGPFKVVLVTRHMALKKVPRSITQDNITQALCLTARYLKKYFAIERPRIGVCGLNPHSGESGVLGDEERKIIRPAIIRAKRYARIQGPLASDTIFYSARQNKFDAVCAMYHDQGLIALKTLALHQGVNLTLGLPFIRTSVDHGTAYDLAGKNIADPGSMVAAIKLAIKISRRIKHAASSRYR